MRVVLLVLVLTCLTISAGCTSPDKSTGRANDELCVGEACQTNNEDGCSEDCPEDNSSPCEGAECEEPLSITCPPETLDCEDREPQRGNAYCGAQPFAYDLERDHLVLACATASVSEGQYNTGFIYASEALHDGIPDEVLLAGGVRGYEDENKLHYIEEDVWGGVCPNHPLLRALTIEPLDCPYVSFDYCSGCGERPGATLGWHEVVGLHHPALGDTLLPGEVRTAEFEGILYEISLYTSEIIYSRPLEGEGDGGPSDSISVRIKRVEDRE